VTPDSLSFGVRLDGPTLARLDAYAERNGRKRGWAAARSIAAGLDALEGAPAAPASPPPIPGSNATAAHPPGGAASLDVPAVAGALYDLIGPQLAGAIAEGLRRGRRSDLAPVGVVGVARVVDALRGAFEATREGAALADREARAVLSRAVIEAINALAYGDTDEAAVPSPSPPREETPGPQPPRQPARAVRGPQGERRGSSPDRRAPPPRLADTLKAAREARGLSQRGAAESAGVPIGIYQRAEQGKDVRPDGRQRLEAWISATPGSAPAE
jgi:hypothetical protein